MAAVVFLLFVTMALQGLATGLQDLGKHQKNYHELFNDLATGHDELIKNVKLLEDLLTDPCRPGNHKVIDDPQRSSKEGRGRLCDDDLTPGWYRFLLNKASAVIPTTCPKQDACGSIGPTWLNLTRPLPAAAGQEIQANVCSRLFRNCCDSHSTITVRNCGLYYVYRLQPLPKCPGTYCAQL
ncbi:hypothetical protein ACOMHN_001551 [Nucella lapillus]